MKAVDYAGADPVLVSSSEAILDADKLILPGVGAAGLAISKLKENNLDQALKEAVFTKGTPLMGICVGMQLLANSIHEFGHHQGLGWIDAEVISLQDKGVKNHPVPHMGWADVEFSSDLSSLSSKLGPHKSFYFAHSFTLTTNTPEIISARTEYETELVAGVSFENVRAFQFHPEKSQVAGDMLMQWFVDWEP